MKKLNCEIGEKFGYWEVIDNTPIIKSGHTYIRVRCKCGKEEEKSLSDLKSGRSTGCRSCKARERSPKIQIGDKYKHWIIVDGPVINDRRQIMWQVKCDCGLSEPVWKSAWEITTPTKCQQCSKCGHKIQGDNLAIKNGKIGDMTLGRLNRLKRSAKSRNLEFNLTIEYLWNLFKSQKQICAITGDYISNIEEASLDRIDSSKGYIEGNVQWVTYQANVSKHTMTMKQLYEFCRKVLNHANQQPSTPLTKCEGSETNS